MSRIKLTSPIVGVAYGQNPPPLQSTPQRPNSDRLLNNLGAKVVLAAPSNLFSTDGYRGPISQVERILAAGPEVMRSEAPGSWICNISAQYIWPNGTPVAGTYGSVTARVWFGSGGTQQYVDVDAWNSKIVIPGERVSIDVFWECLGYAPSFGPINVFPVEITCTLERSNLGVNSLPPIKSYWVLELVDQGGSVGNLSLAIPPYATAWNFVPMNPTVVGTSPLTQGGANVGAQDFVLPTVLESMARMNQFRALPPAAKTLFLESDYPFSYPGRVQFQVNS